MKTTISVFVIILLLINCFGCNISELNQNNSSQRLTEEDAISILDVNIKSLDGKDEIAAEFRNISNSNSLWSKDLLLGTSVTIEINSALSFGGFNIIMINADKSENEIYASSASSNMSTAVISYDILNSGEYHLKLISKNATGNLSVIMNYGE